MKVEVLMSPDCSHSRRTSELVAEVVREHAPGADVEVIMVATRADAERLAFPGSPTVRVNGIDIEPEAPGNVGLG